MTEIKQAKRGFVNERLTKAPNQSKETWKIINEERNKETSLKLTIYSNSSGSHYVKLLSKIVCMNAVKNVRA